MTRVETNDPLPQSAALPATPGSIQGAQLRRTLGLVTLAWIFGSVWISTTAGAPFTLFAKALHASGFQIGLLSALPFFTSLISMPASLFIERTGKRKVTFLFGLYMQRLLWFPIALLPPAILHYGGAQAGAWATGTFLVLFFFMHSGQAIGGPAWTTWMADIVPPRANGKYFARRKQWGFILAIPACIFVGWLLDTHVAERSSSAALRWCGLIFMGAAVFGIADIALFQFVPDVYRAPQRGGKLVASLVQPLRNRQFLIFGGFVGVMIFAVAFMGQFLNFYLMDKVFVGKARASNAQIQAMTLVVPMVAQFFALPLWGKAADRYGKKPLLVLSSLGFVPVGFAWCLLGPNNIWLGYLLAAAGAALWNGVEVANFNLVLELSASNEKEGGGGSSYVAINSVIINVAGCLGGLAAGLIAQALRTWHWSTPLWTGKDVTFYDVLFILSGVLRLLAVVIFLPILKEPEARPTVEALRFMAANIYNNVSSAALLPLRMFRVRS